MTTPTQEEKPTNEPSEVGCADLLAVEGSDIEKHRRDAYNTLIAKGYSHDVALSASRNILHVS